MDAPPHDESKGGRSGPPGPTACPGSEAVGRGSGDGHPGSSAPERQRADGTTAEEGEQLTGGSGRRDGSEDDSAAAPFTGTSAAASSAPSKLKASGRADVGVKGTSAASSGGRAGARGEGGLGGGGGDGGSGSEDPPPSLGVRVALSMLAFYRNVMSPLMPSTCRFLPTCSNYSIESYKKFGVTRGTVLTAWRLLRCNPWGGRGYDPPSWPPVGLEAVYQLPYTPEITVVLGAALAYWLVASTIESLVY